MMKKTLLIAACFALALSVLLFAGCSDSKSSNLSEGGFAGTPALMPAGHEGRYQNLGAEGCYGCHGANQKANPMLASATAMPVDHYAGANLASFEIDPGHVECQTCHAQG